MRVRTLRPGELDPSLRMRWLGWQRSDSTLDSPFFHPEFTCVVGAARDDVEIGLLEQDGAEIGAFPFHRDHRGVGRPVGMRLSDFQGVVAEDGREWSAEDLLRGCGLEAWHFDHLVGSQRAFARHRLSEAASPFIALSAGFEGWVEERRASGSSAIRQTLRKARKLEREVGPLRFEWHTAESHVFESLLRWKSEQRRRSGSFDVLRLDWAREVLERVRSTRCDGFAGVLSALYAGDALVATHLGMASDRVLHLWFPAYDPDHRRHSPGSVLLLELARGAAGRGLVRFDLGRGDERYKSSFMSGTLPLAEGCVDGRLLHGAARRLWWQVRRSGSSPRLRGAARLAKRMLRPLRAHPEVS